MEYEDGKYLSNNFCDCSNSKISLGLKVHAWSPPEPGLFSKVVRSLALTKETFSGFAPGISLTVKLGCNNTVWT